MLTHVLDYLSCRWPDPVDWSHLTSLTKLDMNRECPFMVQTEDILPPNLLELETGFILDWDAVLRLQDLQKLSLQVSLDDDLTAERVNRISGQLTSLISVGITECPSRREALTEQLIRAYAQLPLHSLERVAIKADAMPAVAPHLNLLASVTGLKLDVQGQHGWQGDTWRCLAQGLTPLTQLVDLDLMGPALGDGLAGGRIALEATAAASVPVARALAGMHALRSLKLFLICLSTEAVLVLAKATALTRLELRMTGLDDFGVNSLVINLPDLQVFDISENNEVTNAVMPVIGNHLRKLRCIKLEHTHVNALGLGCLTSLRQLQEVRVCKLLLAAAQGVVGPRSTVHFVVQAFYCNEC
jgi:hypothetical protein